MEFTTDNWVDIERYYNKTYVKLEQYGDKLFYISSVSPDKVCGTTEDGDVFEIQLHEEPYHVNYLLPHKSVFQLGERSAMLYRIPAKQYKRGLCAENTRISYIDVPGKLNGMTLNFTYLKQYVTKQAYPSLETAMKNTNGFQSVALSPFMSYVPKGHLLFVYNTQVAKLVKGAWQMKSALFRDEVAAISQGTKFKVAV